MAVNRRFVAFPPSEVFAVLADGGSYERWVVGTNTIRAVEPGWPAVGTRLLYELGRAGGRKNDETRVIDCVPGVSLELEASGRPFGSMRIQFYVDTVYGGSLMTVAESPKHGLIRLLHNGAFDLVILVRNRETLRRFERELERRSRALPELPELPSSDGS